jgi:hypothetical protein
LGEFWPGAVSGTVATGFVGKIKICEFHEKENEKGVELFVSINNIYK